MLRPNSNPANFGLPRGLSVLDRTSRTEKRMKPKIGRVEAHHTGNPRTYFEVKGQGYRVSQSVKHCCFYSLYTCMYAEGGYWNSHAQQHALPLHSIRRSGHYNFLKIYIYIYIYIFIFILFTLFILFASRGNAYSGEVQGFGLDLATAPVGWICANPVSFVGIERVGIPSSPPRLHFAFSSSP